jgi:hypothetical protein
MVFGIIGGALIGLLASGTRLKANLTRGEKALLMAVAIVGGSMSGIVLIFFFSILMFFLASY